MFGDKTQILGHGKMGKGYNPFSFFYFGKFTLISFWMVFLSVLFVIYIFTFHTQSDFEKETYKLKYDKSNLLEERQLEQQRLSDMQSLDQASSVEGMVDVGEVEYL